jgi:hypothetical protein
MNQDIISYIHKGQYLIAIKRYREIYEVGFSEAEQAVFDIRKDITYLSRTGRHQSDSSYDYPTLCNRVVELLKDGNKLRAIRFYQDNCQVDFKQALAAIQSLGKEYSL